MVLPRNEQLMNDIFAAGILPDRTSPHAVDYTVGSGVLQDADAQVRLTGLLALSELPASKRAADAIVELIVVPGNARDPWLPDAAAIAGVKQGPEVALALMQRRPPRQAAQDTAYLTGISTAVRRMTHYFASKENTAAIVSLLQATAQTHPIIGNGVLVGIAGEGERPGQQGQQQRRGGGPPGGWPEEKAPTLTAEQRTALAEARRAAPPELADGFTRVAARWGMPDLFR
jgi:hypothetical protein